MESSFPYVKVLEQHETRKVVENKDFYSLSFSLCSVNVMKKNGSEKREEI